MVIPASNLIINMSQCGKCGVWYLLISPEWGDFYPIVCSQCVNKPVSESVGKSAFGFAPSLSSVTELEGSEMIPLKG